MLKKLLISKINDVQSEIQEKINELRQLIIIEPDNEGYKGQFTAYMHSYQMISSIVFSKQVVVDTKPIEVNSVICDTCGSVTDDFIYGPDPYTSEVHGRDIPVNLCRNCYNNQLDEI